MLLVPYRMIMSISPSSSKLSQNVFLEADDAGRIHLAEGDDAGSHFFKSLAELNRTKFVDQNASARVALSTVHSIWNKGHGKIYRKDPETDEWVLVSKIGEAQQLVLRALETILGVDVSEESNEAAASTSLCAGGSQPSVTSMENTSTQRRHSANTLEAASSLLMVQEAAAAGELEDEDEDEDELMEQELPSEEQTAQQVQFENTDISLIASFDSSSSFSSPPSPESDHKKAARAVSKRPEQRRRRSACQSTDFVADQPGMEFANVGSSDVLCGGSGEGVLAIRHEGNKRFLKVVESQVEDFQKADDKAKLRMAQQAVESNPRGRFLAYNPETGLWHELKRDKAWFKTLRTFLKRQQYRLDSDQSDEKQRTLPRPV